MSRYRETVGYRFFAATLDGRGALMLPPSLQKVDRMPRRRRGEERIGPPVLVSMTDTDLLWVLEKILGGVNSGKRVVLEDRIKAVFDQADGRN